MFTEKFDIMVNTVNCVGVMGKGIALEFKQRFPNLYTAYIKACKSGEIKPGALWYYVDTSNDRNWQLIINFATKDSWKNPSKYEWIESGLLELKAYLASPYVKWNIGIPALGCGCGGLSWPRVKAMMEKHLSELNHHIVVFEPKV